MTNAIDILAKHGPVTVPILDDEGGPFVVTPALSASGEPARYMLALTHRKTGLAACQAFDLENLRKARAALVETSIVWDALDVGAPSDTGPESTISPEGWEQAMNALRKCVAEEGARLMDSRGLVIRAGYTLNPARGEE